MAVQKSKKSRSKRGMRRANDFIKLPSLTTDAYTGEVHVRHHVSEQGYYKGKEVIKSSNKQAQEQKES